MNNRANNPPLTRAEAQLKYDRARHNLLAMIVLTLINLVLLALDTGTMFLFSASVPYILVAFGIYSGFPLILAVFGVIAAIAMVLYFLCWLLSKKRPGWMVLALVLFILDTVLMVAFYFPFQGFSDIFDLLIHVWVLYYLILGTKYGFKLKKWPEEPEAESAYPEDVSADTEELPAIPDSLPLRRADPDVKFRILLEGDHLGRHICYRRVGRVNELVIDGYVYDEVEMLMERPHQLSANLDGHLFSVGLREGSTSFIAVDGVTVATRLRLV